MGGKWGVYSRPAALLLAILLFVPAAAFGEASDFLPTIFSPRGVLEVNMAINTDERASGDRVARSSNTYATERLRLSTNGFVYHPRFIQFLFQGAGGLSQERSTSTYGEGFSETGLGAEYEFRTKFLPEHPYNLELYTLRRTPLIQGRSSMETRTTTYDKGAIFIYKARPVSLNLGYDVNRLESKTSFDESRTASAAGSLFMGPVNNSAGYSRTDSLTSLGMNSSSDHSYFNNTITLFGASLSSKVGQARQEQSVSSAYTLHTDQFTWAEQFNAKLPWNFTTSASYNFQKDERTRQEAAAGPMGELMNETKSSNLAISHRIYESVRTNYALSETRTQSSTGHTRSLSNALNGAYTKKMPDGRITIGAQGSHLVTEQKNSLLIIGETYAAPLFGAFTLSRGSIDPKTIAIEVVSDSGVLVPLTLNTHYIAEPYGNTIRITILSLPAAITAGHAPSDSYTFSVSYSTVAGTGTLALNAIGYTVNLSLFNNFINPYYNNLHTRQTVLTGYIPGGAQDTKTNTVGIAIRRSPYELTSEYQSMESNAYPSRSQKNTAAYSQRMTKTTSLSTSAEHTETVYGTGYQGTGGATEKMTALNAMLNKNIPEQNILASLIASYIQRRTTIQSDSYVLTGSLSWNRGTLSVNMGASLNHSESSGAIGRQATLSQSYYLLVSRRLF